MYAVVSCKKFYVQTLRIVDFGNCEDPKSALANMQAMEYPLCGPCSHTELTWHNWFTIHSDGYETQEEAIEAARDLDAENPGKYEFPLRRQLQEAS